MSRASVHNISIMESLELGAGDTVTVYKANMIIPQIEENLTRSGVRDIPKICPVCGGKTEIREINEVKSLYCTNPDCQAKKIKSFTLLVSRLDLSMSTEICSIWRITGTRSWRWRGLDKSPTII